ncbi:hypothetical protein HID58_064538 [Brassica napus]|uniref:Uncharacterized protein n=1 Tax=Brassica napus TaxID=3708 RepID=A0ABQ7ZA96_BRANA|nr:hypothetical protein HID58_064538 [Brassica napus]
MNVAALFVATVIIFVFLLCLVATIHVSFIWEIISKFSCFEPTKAFFLLYDLEILEITMFFDLRKSSKLQVCTSELMYMWTVTSLDLISS